MHLEIIELIHPNSIDADYPIACDDEYWYTDDPKDAFVQPPGKPSVMEYFNATLDLNEILAFCSRTLVSIPFADYSGLC